jgi:hypothetical protein
VFVGELKTRFVDRISKCHDDTVQLISYMMKFGNLERNGECLLIGMQLLLIDQFLSSKT